MFVEQLLFSCQKRQPGVTTLLFCSTQHSIFGTLSTNLLNIQCGKIHKLPCFAITEVKVQEYTKNNFLKDLNESLGKEQKKTKRVYATVLPIL